jgi:hypothetical protein
MTSPEFSLISEQLLRQFAHPPHPADFYDETTKLISKVCRSSEEGGLSEYTLQLAQLLYDVVAVCSNVFFIPFLMVFFAGNH